MAHQGIRDLLRLNPAKPPKRREKSTPRTPDQQLRQPIRFEDGSETTFGEEFRMVGRRRDPKGDIAAQANLARSFVGHSRTPLGRNLIPHPRAQTLIAPGEPKKRTSTSTPPSPRPTPPQGPGFGEPFPLPPLPTPGRETALQKILDTEFTSAIKDVRFVFGDEIADSIPQPETTTLGLRGASGIARGIDFNNPGPFGLGFQNFLDRAQHAIEALPGKIESKLPAALTFDKAIEVSEDVPFEHAPLTVRHEIAHHILDQLQVGGDRNTYIEGDDHHTLIRESAGLGTTGVNFQQLRLETEAFKNPSRETEEAAVLGQFDIVNRSAREGTLRQREVPRRFGPGEQEERRELKNFIQAREERLGRLQAEGQVSPFTPTPSPRPEPPRPAATPPAPREEPANLRNILGMNI